MLAHDVSRTRTRYRVPEPVRQADMRSREVIRAWLLERRGDEAETKQGSPSPPPSHDSSKRKGGGAAAAAADSAGAEEHKNNDS